MSGEQSQSLLKTCWRGIVNILLPHHCALCHSPGDPLADSLLCETCLGALPRITSPYCPVCGKPIQSGAVNPFNAPCGECRLKKPIFRICRSAGIYEDGLKQCIHIFKYEGREELAGPLGRFMAEFVGREGWPGHYDAIIPVPIHRSRFRTRGFNQAYLLARALEVVFEAPVLSRVLRKNKPGVSQSTLDRAMRLRNVRGSFSFAPGANVKNMRLLLLDDVYTTGATAEECVRVLYKHGAGGVDIFTLARGR